MGKRPLDLESFPRRAQYELYRGYANPYAGLTVNVDITDFLAGLRRRGAPFFLGFCWCVTRAANAVPAFRLRLSEEGIAEYDFCPASVTLALPDESYCYCKLPDAESFGEYLPLALAAKEAALRAARMEDEEDVDSLLFVTSTPWLSFTQIVHPLPQPADSNPRIAWGRYFSQEGKTLIPVSVLCHHALVDGRQIAAFFAALERELAALS
ncbi:MAG: chloramphenicol acetyltransferase [Oscillospiraceae bacterium]|nr:chloramphenicol acetyltransferase [Oscillospiraceae bacterium]